MKRFLLVLTWVMGVAAVGAAQPQTPPGAPAGDADTGRKLYTTYGCYQCHGREAQGSSATGPRLAPQPMPWPAFSRYVRNPSNQMPPYTARIVSDQDLAHIYAFLRTVPAPKKVEELPLLQD